MEENENVYLESLKVRNYELYKYFKRGLELISILKSKMYEAYIVGGAVRDFMLNIDFKDIDIATSATPNEVLDIFKDLDVDDRYASFGSVVIREAGFHYEITTFRNEEYVKFKIKDVHYSKKLVEDIIRRDYTINAFALTPNLTIIDLVDGKTDLQKRIVRIIGSGKRRYREDPSRIIRGLKLVSKYNYKIEPNTLRAMRKSRAFLKEISDLKLTTEMEQILSDPYGLQALYVIDDNHLFKYLPNYAYWVQLMIKKYKKLTLNEKFCLLYRITGDMPKNIESRKEKACEIQKLFDVSQNLSVNKVDPMMVFRFGSEILLAADRIAKAYHSRYRMQKGKIKKIEKHLKIKSVNELNFSARELVSMMKDEQKYLTNQIMEELIYKVLNNEISNTSDALQNAAYHLLNPSQKEEKAEDKTKERKINLFTKDRNEKNDRYFDDRQEEKKLYEKVYDTYDPNIDGFDGWDLIPVDESYYEDVASKMNENHQASSADSKENLVSNARLLALKKEYDEDYYNIYKIYIKGIEGYYQMTEGEQKMKIAEAKQQAKDFLLRNNPKYVILHERGMIE